MGCWPKPSHPCPKCQRNLIYCLFGSALWVPVVTKHRGFLPPLVPLACPNQNLSSVLYSFWKHFPIHHYESSPLYRSVSYVGHTQNSSAMSSLIMEQTAFICRLSEPPVGILQRQCLEQPFHAIILSLLPKIGSRIDISGNHLQLVHQMERLNHETFSNDWLSQSREPQLCHIMMYKSLPVGNVSWILPCRPQLREREREMLQHLSINAQIAGPSGFMGYGDLWGFNLIVLIFYKSSLGFMGYISPSAFP